MTKKKVQFSPRIFAEWGELFKNISPEQRGEILLGITMYPNYTPENNPVWGFIKSQIDKEFELFTERCEKNSQVSKDYWNRTIPNGTERIPNDNERYPKQEQEQEYKHKLKKKKAVVSDDWFPSEETQRKLSDRGIVDIPSVVEYFIGQCQAKGISYVNYDRAILNWNLDKFKKEKSPALWTDEDFERSIYEGRR